MMCCARDEHLNNDRDDFLTDDIWHLFLLTTFDIGCSEKKENKRQRHEIGISLVLGFLS